MNRRKVLKSVAATPVFPTVSDSDEMPFEYLESLFRRNYRTVVLDTQNPSYMAYWGPEMDDRVENIVYHTSYSARLDDRTWNLVYKTDDFASYKYYPQSHYEAYRLCEIARTQGLESILSVVSGLELKDKEIIRNYKEKI